MHSAVFLDKNNSVIRPAPLWNDQRTYKECEYLKNKIGLKTILELTSNKPTNSFTLTKVLWLKNNEAENFKKLKKFCLSKDYVKMRLSGSLSTDPSDASGTLCFDVKNHKWSEELFKSLDLDTSILPEVRNSGESSAFLSKEASEKTGLPSGLPILTGAGDTAAEMMGNGIDKDGDCLIILGTGGVILNYHSKHFKSDGKLDMFCYPDGKYYSLGVTLSSSASLMWSLDNVGFDLQTVGNKMDKDLKYSDFTKYIKKNKFQILDEHIKDIPPGAGGLIFLPYLAGERSPYFDPDARGVLFGLILSHNNKHILRSVMEGVAFSQRDCYEIIKKRGIKIKNIVITGGGSKNDLWCQIYSDIFNCNITRISSGESAALGMCMLGAVSAGIFSSMEKSKKVFLKKGTLFKPNNKNIAIYNELYDVYKSLYPRLKNTYAKIGNILNEKQL